MRITGLAAAQYNGLLAKVVGIDGDRCVLPPCDPYGYVYMCMCVCVCVCVCSPYHINIRLVARGLVQAHKAVSYESWVLRQWPEIMSVTLRKQ